MATRRRRRARKNPLSHNVQIGLMIGGAAVVVGGTVYILTKSKTAQAATNSNSVTIKGPNGQPISLPVLHLGTAPSSTPSPSVPAASSVILDPAVTTSTFAKYSGVFVINVPQYCSITSVTPTVSSWLPFAQSNVSSVSLTLDGNPGSATVVWQDNSGSSPVSYTTTLRFV